VGDCVGQHLHRVGRRRAVIYMGPIEKLMGVVYVLELREGFSTFGAPTPEALDYCVEGVGEYVKELEPPFSLDELLRVVPEEMRERLLESRCVKYAFYSSRIDPRPLKTGVYVTRDFVLFYNLGQYFPLYSTEVGRRKVKTRCNGETPPLEIKRVELKVMDAGEFYDFIYWAGVRKMATGFIYKIPLILLRLRRRI
ncbi:MAG: hypothetical protein QXR18_02800, partial [Pyrobaculum sp.]